MPRFEPDDTPPKRQRWAGWFFRVQTRLSMTVPIQSPALFFEKQPRFTLGATPPEFSDQVIAFPANHRSQAGEHSLCGNQTLLKGSPDAALATL